MNCHKGRNTQHCLTIERALDKLGLKSVWDKFDCDFTHIHTDNKSVSKIDHFMCNERLFNFIEQCSPIHSGDNFSRHSPIVIKLRVDDIPQSVSVNVDFGSETSQSSSSCSHSVVRADSRIHAEFP